jgi:hypothetical protein
MQPYYTDESNLNRIGYIMKLLREHVCKNKRRYQIFETGTEYVDQEYPTGGFVIYNWIPTSPTTGNWCYLDNSPDTETLTAFLTALDRLPPVSED